MSSFSLHPHLRINDTRRHLQGSRRPVIEGLCLKLRDAGVPVDRATSAIELRHAERAAIFAAVGARLRLGAFALKGVDQMQTVFAPVGF
jgi:hypothetical protein